MKGIFFFFFFFKYFYYLFSQRYSLDNYSTSRTSSGVNLIRQNSYISAVRSAHQNDQADFGKNKKIYLIA
jgi:hypothetical protein